MFYDAIIPNIDIRLLLSNVMQRPQVYTNKYYERRFPWQLNLKIKLVEMIVELLNQALYLLLKVFVQYVSTNYFYQDLVKE